MSGKQQRQIWLVSCSVGPVGLSSNPRHVWVCRLPGSLNLHTIFTQEVWRQGGDRPLCGCGEGALCPHDGWACTALVLAGHPPKPEEASLLPRPGPSLLLVFKNVDDTQLEQDCRASTSSHLLICPNSLLLQ